MTPAPMTADAAHVITRLLHAIDVLDWPSARACLADRVRTDYTELFGGEPADVTGDGLIDTWRALLPGFDATQHLTGPVLTTERDGGVRLDTHVRAYHRVTDHPDGSEWSVHGHYEALLTPAGGGLAAAPDWRISGLTLRLFYQEGNTGLVTFAAERAGSSPRPVR